MAAAGIMFIFAKAIDAKISGAHVSVDAVSVLDAAAVQGFVVAKINGVAEILGT